MTSDATTSYSIRVATLHDEQSVTDLLDASYPSMMQGYYDESVLVVALPILCSANTSLLTSGTFYLAETEQRLVVGCGGWTREHPGNGAIEPGLGHMRHFATHPKWVGRSVGRTIYRTCEQEAQSGDVTRFESQSSLNAEGFYTALGFERVKPIDVFLGNDISLPGVLMQRSI